MDRRRHRRWISSVLSALYVLALFSPSKASGSALSELLEGAARVSEQEAARVAERAALETAATFAARQTGQGAATLTIDSSGQLQLAILVAGSAAATIGITSGDDLLRAMRNFAGALFVTPETLASNQPLLTEVLRSQQHAVRLVESEVATPVAVELRTRGNSEDLVVVRDPSMTFSVDAWGRRGLLNRSLMPSLYARRRIVVLASKTDQVQREAFQRLLGDRVSFASTNEELASELKKLNRHLTIVVGHVENGAFTVRDAIGQSTLSSPIEAVNGMIERTASFGLLLGCQIAVESASTGPIGLIDAFDAAASLSTASQAETPLEFLSMLAHSVGPLHVETDVYGQLRVVSFANKTVSDYVAKGGSIFSAVISRSLGDPTITQRVFVSLWEIISFIFAMTITGWLSGMLILGIGPKKLWTLVAENYQAVMGYGEDADPADLGAGEAMLLLAVGPWISLLLLIGRVFTDFLPTLLLGCVGLLAAPVIWLANPKIFKISREFYDRVHERRCNWYWLTNGCDAALIGLVGAGLLVGLCWLIELPFGAKISEHVSA